MGKDHDPWQLGSFNCASNAGPPAFAKHRTNSMAFPSFADPYGFVHLNSATTPLTNPAGFTSGHKTFMVLDPSGNQRSLMFGAVGTQCPYVNATANFGFSLEIPPSNAAVDLPASNETNVSNVNEEMHEDTEEIDALLYSDSDNDDYEEEDASTGHSPLMTATDDLDDGEEVLQPPAPKRRRTESGNDLSLADTASSNRCTSSGSDDDEDDHAKRAKRERIQETVGVLRRIIPGGKGKDAATVLDEAIRYLKSLRVKAKEGLGVAPAPI